MRSRNFSALIFGICFVTTSLLSADPISLTLRRYHEADATLIARTNDGGFVVVAKVEDTTVRVDPTLILKFSSTGQPEWETTIADIIPCSSDCLVISGSDIYLAGTSVSQTDERPGYSKIVKLNSTGEIDWQKVLELQQPYAAWIQGIALLPSGSIVGVGYWTERASRYSNRWHRNHKAFIVQIGSDGTEEAPLTRVPGETGQSSFFGIAVVADGSFLAVGVKYKGEETQSYGNTGAPTQPRPYLVKYSANREVSHQRLAADDIEGTFSFVLGAPSAERFLVSGMLNRRPYFELVTPAGQVRRPISVLDNDFTVYGGVALSSGSFVLAGGKTIGERMSPAAVEISPTGLSVWNRVYASGPTPARHEWLSSVIPTAVGFLFGGSTAARELWLFETDRQGIRPAMP